MPKLSPRAKSAAKLALGALLILLTLVVFSPVSFGAVSQCLWKAYYPVDEYMKSGKKYSSISAVLADHQGGGFSSATLPTDKATDHSYHTTYDVILAPYAAADSSSSSPALEATAILEVGVKKGGSLKLFREFFPPSTRIYGVDIDPSIPTFPRDPGIKTIVMDSQKVGRDSKVKQAFGTKPMFDLILDDGCHLLSCIGRTFDNFWPLLKDGGLYIIEDYPKYWKTHPNFFPNRRWGNRKDIGRICIKEDTGFMEEFVVVLFHANSKHPMPKGCLDLDAIEAAQQEKEGKKKKPKEKDWLGE